MHLSYKVGRSYQTHSKEYINSKILQYSGIHSWDILEMGKKVWKIQHTAPYSWDLKFNVVLPTLSQHYAYLECFCKKKKRKEKAVVWADIWPIGPDSETIYVTLPCITQMRHMAARALSPVLEPGYQFYRIESGQL